jgi:hypothetical protein
MINHARTLLLNTAQRNNHITTDTAAEYVPAEFFPVNLTNALRLVRRVLFGSKPDARFINLRIRELMGYVHQTEFAHYVYDLDPRVTYWPTQAEDFKDATRSQTIITQLSGPAQPLTVVGAFKPDHSVGVAIRKYLIASGVKQPTLAMKAMRLESPDTSNTAVAIQQLGTTAEPDVFDAGTSGDTTVALLPQTDLKLLLNFVAEPSEYASISTETEDFLLYETYADTGIIESEQPANTMASLAAVFESVLAQWLVVVKAVPQPIITTLMPTLELLGEPVFLELFGVVDEEPYATFKNLWFDHYSPVYRLAGLTLAIIYRTEELRRNKNAG